MVVVGEADAFLLRAAGREFLGYRSGMSPAMGALRPVSHAAS